jgi:hypothetical protein
VVVIPRDDTRPEVYRLRGGQYAAEAADPRGMVWSEALSVRFGHEAAPHARLVVEDTLDPGRRAVI